MKAAAGERSWSPGSFQCSSLWQPREGPTRPPVAGLGWPSLACCARVALALVPSSRPFPSPMWAPEDLRLLCNREWNNGDPVGSGATRRRWRQRAPPGRRQRCRRPGKNGRGGRGAGRAGRPPPAAGNGLAGAGLMAAPSCSPSLPLFLPARPGVAGSWTLGVVRFPSSGGEAAARPSARRALGAPLPGQEAAAPSLPHGPGGGSASLPAEPPPPSPSGRRFPRGRPLGLSPPPAPRAERGVSLPRPTCPSWRSASLGAREYGFVPVHFYRGDFQ